MGSMRASLKLGVIVLVLVLCGLLARTGPVRDVMLGVHVLWVTAYGSPADVARLIDDADQAMAEPNNNDELYACGVTWRVTLAELRASGASDEEALQGASAAVAAQRGGTTRSPRRVTTSWPRETWSRIRRLPRTSPHCRASRSFTDPPEHRRSIPPRDRRRCGRRPRV
jgi:hypothetical protein